MASRSRARAIGANYDVGYGKPPKASQFPKGLPGYVRPQPTSPVSAPDPGLTLDHLVQDAALKVMGERVKFEVSPGRRRSMPRAEALVRELYNQAVYDHRAAKLLLELFGRAKNRQDQLREEQARAEQERLKRERDEEYRRELARELAEHEEFERRRQKNLRRRERTAEKRAAQAAAEAAKLPLEAVEPDVAGPEEPPQSLLESELGAECPSEGAEDVREPFEDARLYGEDYKKSLAAARKPKARPVTPAADANLGEGVPVAAAISVAPRPVRQWVPVARPNGPLIANGQPLTGHTFGFSGTSKPPPRRNN